ncbi:twin-arginine translocation signal domain-containing protein [Natronolimnobius sp. AArcel1]|uniref:twin-arginine translocation signal domain-containing protein n=1 Tax=Natronolimnobius sp. AArcel1 TaxID=1679093 RepID=UPI0013EAA7C4|nr:twin-arginine translocation signal domain-containing protein [Natronolimnobius sp. AArcel1]NGM68836.1 twin-arginine translocation signal domain-containing protein [Natronolimnobius sp. AArcel1]
MNSNPHADNTDGDRTETTDHPQRDPDAAASHDDGETSRALSRRRFVQATGATAGALALGGTAVAGAQPLEETCESFGEIDVGDGDFLLINNDWGESVEDSGFEMCSWLAEDGSYGYEWTTRPDGGEPNYPQVLLGTKPWGDDSDVGSFPVQRGDIDELTLEVDIDLNVSGGEWNLAEEWWLMEQPPDQQIETHTHEIMLVLEWSDEHSHGGVDEPGVWTDQFGNEIDYWTVYSGGGGTDAAFHIFRVSGGLTTGQVDLSEIIDFMSERYGLSEDLWVSGIEVGNEYWGGVQGDVTYNTLDVTVNGTTYESGSDAGDGSDPEPESIEVGEYETQDSTDDGLHNDFTGDGETTHDDVTAFFENLEDESVQNNPEAFDFAGNDEVSFADVVDLLRQV